MKLQSILLLTGIAAGLMTVSCQVFPSTTEKEAEEFYGRPAPDKAKAEAYDQSVVADFYNEVNSHIDRRLNEFNEKEESELPVFTPERAKDDFRDLSFVRTADQIGLLSIDFTATGEIKWSFVIDRESRTLTRTIGDKSETFTFEPFSNGIRPAIPYDAHILYAFATDFNRIAKTVTLRSFEKLEKGENPAIAQQENEANIDAKGKKKDKNYVEIKPKVTTEPAEFRVDNRWCHCYDVTLKSICAPAVSMSLFVSNEEKTISRIDLVMDDGTKKTFIMDWREQDGIVLPRVIRCVDDNMLLFRDDANVIPRGSGARALADATAAADAVSEEEEEAPAEEEMVVIDASADAFEED